MKKKQIRATMVFLVLNVPILLLGAFDSLHTIPGHITVNDSVKIAYQYTTTSLPNKIFARNITVMGYHIQIDICCGYGQQTSVGFVRDTINLGVLPAGNYICDLTWNRASLADMLCNNSFLYDTGKIEFNVNSLTDVESNVLGTCLSVIPNPTKSTLLCKVNDITQNEIIQITSIEGKAVLTGIPVTQTNFEIDVSTLPAGIYFLQLSDERQRVVKKFVKY